MDSLVAQSMKEIEIIAVNDGSTDQSGEILAQYANKDERVIVLNKANGGVSSARNEGIEKAQGEYIGFVDPDDWIERDMYEELYHTADAEQADIVMCTYVREFGTHSKAKIFNLPEKVCYHGEEITANIVRRLIGPLHEEIGNPELLDAWGTVWSKLYRSELIKQNHLRFTDLQEIGSNEDSLFNIEACYEADKFIFLNQPYYHYWRANNSSLSESYKPNLKEQWFNLYNKIENFIIEKSLEDNFLLALNNRICLNTLGLGLTTINKGNKVSFFKKIILLQSILNDQRIIRSFSRLEMKYFPVVWRMFYFCAKVRFSIGFYLMLISIDFLRKTVR